MKSHYVIQYRENDTQTWTDSRLASYMPLIDRKGDDNLPYVKSVFQRHYKENKFFEGYQLRLIVREVAEIELKL